jgi:hypothetical protein
MFWTGCCWFLRPAFRNQAQRNDTACISKSKVSNAKRKICEALVSAHGKLTHHPDLAGIVVHLKELQIEMNRFKTQFGEHDTQITH